MQVLKCSLEAWGLQEPGWICQDISDMTLPAWTTVPWRY